MKNFIPQFFISMKNYSIDKFMKDLVAGLIVAIIALPLSIALALASGVTPEQGLYTAIIAGFVISFFGGSTVQISGPTAAFASIVAGIVATKGMTGLAVATFLAGIILIVMGLLKLGSLIKFIPFTITTGFTAGIAVTIVIGQLKDFMGLTFQYSPIETMEKLEQVFTCIRTLNPWAVFIGVLSLAILIFWPKKLGKIPPSLIAVLVAATIVKLGNLEVNTIGNLYTISSALPKFQMPELSFSLVKSVLPDAFTIAILAAIESLLSAVVADGMTKSKHNSNMELIAQGLGNTCSALFGGIPATGAIARTAANIKNGGRSPVSGMVHAVVLLLILVFLMPYAALIPMPTIAAILFMVAYNMSGWRTFVNIVKTSPKSDIAVLLLTFSLTVVFDLVMAIGIGLIIAAFLFLKRMADVSEVREWEYLDSYEEGSEESRLIPVPEEVMVFEITGPMFFGAADKISNLIFDTKKKVLILRMRSVPAMDITALNSLEKLYHICESHKIKLIFSHVNHQPLTVLEKSGFMRKAGSDYFCANIEEALTKATQIIA